MIAQGLSALALVCALLAMPMSLVSGLGVVLALFALLLTSLAAFSGRLGLALIVGLLVTFNISVVSMVPDSLRPRQEWAGVGAVETPNLHFSRESFMLLLEDKAHRRMVFLLIGCYVVYFFSLILSWYLQRRRTRFARQAGGESNE